jgi:hypothetical protein
MKNQKLKSAVDRARESQKGQQQPQQQPKQQSEKKKEKETSRAIEEIYKEGIFTTSISTFSISSLSEEIYTLHNSFILDSASTVHIYNNPERFQSL